MDKVQQRVLIIAAVALLAGASNPPSPRFYPDDPLWKMPPPHPVVNPLKRKINYLYDFISNSVATPGEKQTPGAEIRALDTNTLGEVPDGLWYTNRHYWHPMSFDQLRGSHARGDAPVAPFRVTGAKTEGITPGFQMRDARGRHYFCKPDPLSNPEMASAADVIGSHFFYALGYETPRNYIAYFSRDEIHVDPKASIAGSGGKDRPMTAHDLGKVLAAMPRDREGRYRIMASLEIEGKPLGPFRWFGTREDDPNDIYAHEHRRSLRGLYVFCAWLNHTDIKAGNTFDSLVTRNGVPVLQHHLIDFGSSLGSDSDEAKDARLGHAYMIEKDKQVLLKMFALGFYSPAWERARYPQIPAVGRFEAATFNADSWTSNYPVPAFLNRLPDDEFWAAKQVMNFTDQQIRAIVDTGEYSDPNPAAYITRTLIERRDKIGRTFFTKVLPLDRFAIRNGQLQFEDLAAKHGFTPQREFRIEWYRFDNATRQRTPLPGAVGPHQPAAADFSLAVISLPSEERKTVSVYLRNDQVVGIDRTW